MDDLPSRTHGFLPPHSWEEEPEVDAKQEAQEEAEEIEDQAARVMPPAPALPGAVAAQHTNRVASEKLRAEKPSIIPLTPGGRGRPQPVDLPIRASAGKLAPAKRSPASIGVKSRKSPVATQLRRHRQNGVHPILVVVTLLLIASIILFVFPSADMTVTLAAQAYSWPVIVTASTSQNLTQHTVPLYATSFTASVTQIGQASGFNTSVGTAKATGIVQLTNNGSQPITILTGTVVSTANNVSFATTAEVVVSTGNTGLIFVPIEAQVAGSRGNVAPNTITVIPASSINQIAQANNIPASDVKLSVTNPNATSDGGIVSATTVTQNDVSKLQSQASTQLYQKLQVWLTQQQARGYVLAQPVQKSQLAPYETVKTIPAAGQITSDGTFSETVSLAMPVKFVYSSDLQTQAVAQYHHLPTSRTAPPQGDEPVAGQPVQFQPTGCTSSSQSSTTNASTLCFTATAPVALPITAQQVQNLVIGRNVELVRSQLANSNTGLPGIKAVSVVVYPGFWPWLPFWTQRIAVHFTVDTSSK